MRRNLPAAAFAVAATVVAIVVVLLAAPGEVDPPPAGPGSSTPGAVTALDDVVTTTSGDVRGITDGSVSAWLGLPFAAPPTGRLRWRPPEPAEPWDGVREASSFGASCLQPDPYDFGDAALSAREGTDEACLFLNVARPDDATRDLPVVVWLHGGGFFSGNGATAVAEGSALVERGIVLVSVNYRLGRLGFFAHPSLEQDVANFGLLDQAAALRWVRANVAAFGGDPGNVTLAGGSAGGMSVNALMASPVGRGLFDKAISQSAPSDERSLPLAAARRRGARAFPGLAPRLLRALPPEDLLSSTFNTLSGDAPILDRVLPVPSARAFATGKVRAVPYVVGTTAEEFSDDDYRSFGVDPGALRDALGGDDHDALAAAYGRNAYAADVLDDLVFDLPAVERAITHGRRAPTFRYVFAGPDYSGHGAEGPFVFDTVEGGRGGRLSDAVADYWVAFARTGRPAVPGLPVWPQAVGGGASGYLELGPAGPTARAVEPHLDRLRALRSALD